MQKVNNEVNSLYRTSNTATESRPIFLNPPTCPRRLEYLISVIYDLVANSPAACDEDSLVDPAVPLITSLEGKMKSHTKLVWIDVTLSQLLQDLSFPCTRSCSTQVYRCAIVGEKIISRVQVRRLLINIVVPHNLPIYHRALLRVS